MSSRRGREGLRAGVGSRNRAGDLGTAVKRVFIRLTRKVRVRMTGAICVAVPTMAFTEFSYRVVRAERDKNHRGTSKLWF